MIQESIGSENNPKAHQCNYCIAEERIPLRRDDKEEGPKPRNMGLPGAPEEKIEMAFGFGKQTLRGEQPY